MIKRTQYSEKFKENIVKKSLLTKDLNERQFCNEYGIPISTFRGWRNRYIENNETEKSYNMNFTDKKKLQLLLESKSKSNEELGIFLRENGINEDQLNLWEDKFIDTLDLSGNKKSLSKANKKILQLEKDIHKKDKALAEASALLILKKKADLIWGEEEE
jgi:transposase